MRLEHSQEILVKIAVRLAPLAITATANSLKYHVMPDTIVITISKLHAQKAKLGVQQASLQNLMLVMNVPLAMPASSQIFRLIVTKDTYAQEVQRLSVQTVMQI